MVPGDYGTQGTRDTEFYFLFLFFVSEGGFKILKIYLKPDEDISILVNSKQGP